MKTILLPVAFGILTTAACTRLDDTPPPQTAMKVRVDAAARDDADRHYNTELLRSEYRADLERRVHDLDDRIATLGVAAGSDVTGARAQLAEAWRHLQTASYDDFADAKNRAEISFSQLETLVDDAAQR